MVTRLLIFSIFTYFSLSYSMSLHDKDKYIVSMMLGKCGPIPGKNLIKAVLSHDFDLMHVFSNGVTVRDYAVQYMYYEIAMMEYLIEYDVSFHNDAEVFAKKDKQAFGEYWPKVRMADPTNTDGALRLVRAFLKKGYSVSFILNSDRWRELLIRVNEFDILILKTMFDFGLDKNITFNVYGHKATLLFYFIEKQMLEPVKYILSKGADVNKSCCRFVLGSSSNESMTPLSFALWLKKMCADGPDGDKIIDVLKKHGAKV